MNLIVAGHISNEPRKHQHMLEIYDKQLIESLSLSSLFSKQQRHIVCSPGCFDDEWRGKYSLVYSLITESPELASKWMEKNYSKYDNIFIMSDIGSISNITQGMSLKNMIMFNTVSTEDNFTWQMFREVNFDTIDLFRAKYSISRFIEEPYKFYIFGQNRMHIVRYGIGSLIEFLEEVCNPFNKVECSVYKKEKFPEHRQVKKYNSMLAEVNAFCPEFIDPCLVDILIHDHESEELLCSYAHDNSTFGVISRNRGTNIGRVYVSCDVSRDVVKYQNILQSNPNTDFLIHWDCPENYCNTKYVIKNIPHAHMSLRSEIREQIKCMMSDLREAYYIIFEEGHGYYVISESVIGIGRALKEIGLISVCGQIEMNQIDTTKLRTMLLKTHTTDMYKKAVLDILDMHKYPAVLDMYSIGNDFIDKSGLTGHSVFYFSPFSPVVPEKYSGPMYPQMKYDVILYWGSYFYQGISLKELKEMWEWLYSKLTDKGKIVITGFGLFERDNKKDLQYLLLKNSSKDKLEIRHNPAASYVGKRNAIIADSSIEFLAPWCPMDSETIAIAKSIGFSFKMNCYNHILGLYVYEFTKGASNEPSPEKPIN